MARKNRYIVAAQKAVARDGHTVANPEFARAMRELGRSSATSPHVSKARKGTRSARDSRAIRDYTY